MMVFLRGGRTSDQSLYEMKKIHCKAEDAQTSAESLEHCIDKDVPRIFHWRQSRRAENRGRERGRVIGEGQQAPCGACRHAIISRSGGAL